MGSLHLLGGEKGGVGKSFTARLLAQYMVDHNRPFAGYDTDASHASFSRFYGQFTHEIDPTDGESLDQIIEFAEANRSSQIIVDLAAQTSAKVRQWAGESDVYGLMAELGFDVFYWHVLDESADSVNLLGRQLNELKGTDCKWVVVENHGRGTNFANFEATEVYRQALAQGAHVIRLAPLNPQLAQKIDFNNYSFWAAANSQECMKLTERHRMRVWLEGAYRQIDPLFQTQPATQQQATYT